MHSIIIVMIKMIPIRTLKNLEVKQNLKIMQYISENGFKMLGLVKEYLHGKMDPNMKDILKIIKHTEGDV